MLPLGNLTADPEQDYFSDGLTEEMITQITRLQPERLAVRGARLVVHAPPILQPAGAVLAPGREGARRVLQ